MTCNSFFSILLAFEKEFQYLCKNFSPKKSVKTKVSLLTVQEIFIEYVFRLACRACDMVSVCFELLFGYAPPILIGGIGVAYVVLFGVVLDFLVWGIAVWCSLSFTRLCLMPWRAWSRKKSFLECDLLEKQI